MFQTYLELGFKHVLDINAYDHILFVIALSIIYASREWKKVLILITAFTLGHTISLGLSTLDVVRLPVNLVETLIPLTIIATCIYNIIKVRGKDQKIWIHYLMAGVFGIIHGMGFSNQLIPLLGNYIVIELFGFNIGVELGLLLVVAAVTIISYILVNHLKVSHKIWVWTVSLIVLLVSIRLLFFVLNNS